MKYVKWLALLPVLMFPYSFLLLARLEGGNVWDRLGLLWLVGAAGAGALFVTRMSWSAEKTALAGMLVKLLHIPAYVMWFLVGVALLMFLGPLLAFVMDAMTIALSGAVGLTAVLRCRRDGLLSRRQAVVYGVLQFIFCADVVCAVILYRKTKEVSP